MLNPFPHTTNLQQTTLKTSKQKDSEYYIMKELLLNRVKIIVANGEIANYEHLIILPKCFQKSSAAED